MTDRRPPASEEAERALIGAVLVDPKQFIPTTALVGSDDFFNPWNTEIWEAFLATHRKRGTIDIVTVEDELRMRSLKQFEPGYLLKCVNEMWALSDPFLLARLIREKATVRKVIATCAEIQSQAYGDFGSANEFFRESVVKLSRAALTDSVIQTEALEETTERILGALQRSEKGEATPRIPTGIKRLDSILDGGLEPGTYTVVVAPSGIGKSSFGRQMVFRGARDRKIPALLFTLEDSRQAAFTAGAANLAMLDTRLFKPRTPDNIPTDNRKRWQAIHGALTQAAGLSHLIRIEEHRHIGQIVGVATAWRSKHQGPCLVVVDQISKVRGLRRKGETREQEVAGISQALVELGKDLGVAVVAISQVNDDARKEKRAIALEETRESRAVAQDARVLLSITRDRSQQNGPCTISVLKHSGGATGYCKAMWRGAWNGFEELAVVDDERETA